MNLIDYLQFLEPVQEHVTQVYSTASEIITVLLVLWVINFIGGMIHRTYATGQAFGKFYRSYLHRYLRSFFMLIMNLFNKERDELNNISSKNKSWFKREAT